MLVLNDLEYYIAEKKRMQGKTKSKNVSLSDPNIPKMRVRSSHLMAAMATNKAYTNTTVW